MEKPLNTIDQLFKREVANRGRTSNLSFALFAIFCFFYGLGTVKYLAIIKITSALIVVVAIFRYSVNQKIQNSEFIDKLLWLKICILIWLNSLGWGIILNIASFELQLTGIHFTFVTTLLAGFIGASIVPLSYYAILFIPFQVFLLVPQILIIIYYYLSPLQINYLPVIFLYIMYFFYQLKMYRDYRRQILKLFKYQKGLEYSNQKLRESQIELVTQTVKLVHTSRLAALGEMSTGLVHEINNPITIINSSSKIISKNIENETFDMALIKSNSDRIYRSVGRISKIIKTLKSLANQSDNNPKENCSVAYLIEETRFFCSEHLYSKNITLTIGPIPDAHLICHPVQISQVLINLIKNASDAIVALEDQSLKWINIDFKLEDKKLIIYVKNGGPKIIDEISSKLFTPFYTTKDSETGTGLGLSISKSIMQNHQGDLIFNNTYPNTTFEIHQFTV